MGEVLSWALVLTATPGSRALAGRPVSEVEQALSGRTVLQTRWLSPDEAWDVLFVADEDEDLSPLKSRIAGLLGARPIDVNVVPDDIAFRRKKLLVADMESTIIEQEMLDELADAVGQRARVSEITERAMRGDLDFESALNARVALLAGLDTSVLDEMYRTRVTLMPGAEALLKTMSANGAKCALVSGGFTVFTGPVAARLGFASHQANVLELAEGKLTGRVIPPVLGREAKLAALRRLTAEHGLFEADTMAVGDGANDLDMLKAAGLGVAFRAKPIVRAAAPTSIVHGDLTALLYLQGYQHSEFAT